MKLLLILLLSLFVSGLKSQTWCDNHKRAASVYNILMEDFSKVKLTGDALWKYCKALKAQIFELDRMFEYCPKVADMKNALKRELIAKQTKEDKCKEVRL